MSGLIFKKVTGHFSFFQYELMKVVVSRFFFHRKVKGGYFIRGTAFLGNLKIFSKKLFSILNKKMQTKPKPHLHF